MPWAAAFAALSIPMLVQAEAEEAPPPKHFASQWGLLSLEAKRRIFFKYEKRIRDNSTLEKIFDYFSNQEKDGMKVMTPLDLLAAIVPAYPPSLSNQDRLGSLDGEPAPNQAVHIQLQKATETIFRHFDMDGDGVLSFWEYSLVLTLLSIPEPDVEVIFNVVDLDDSGSIDASEFHEVVNSLQKGRQHSRAPTGRLGRAAGLHMESPSGLLVSFFGKDQTGKLSLGQFMSFLSQLHVHMAELEFTHYDVLGKDAVPGVDFARSLVAVADVRLVDELLNKIDAMPQAMRDGLINKKDFMAMLILARKSHRLEVALHFCTQVGRAITPDEFDKMLKKLANVRLSKEALSVVFAVFGDTNGNLDVHSFTQTLHKRATLWSPRVSQHRWLAEKS